MLPSSDPNFSNPSQVQKQLLSSADQGTVRTRISPIERSTGFKDIIDMLATESFTNAATKPLGQALPHQHAQFEPFSAMDEAYTSIISPKTTDPLMAASQPPSRHQSHSSPSHGHQHGSLHTTPDSKSGYNSPDDYHGASDISVRKSISSATDTELFSDVEDDSDSGDEPSGFEPTEVADLSPANGETLGNERKPCDFEHKEVARNTYHDKDEDTDSDDEHYEPHLYSQPNRVRTFSYESYALEANSPTESQLNDEGFEFHNQLPEERLVGHFNHEALQEAIKDVSPDLPRKQQWYTWRKVMEMLEKDDPNNDDLFDDSDLPNDLSLGSLADHSFGGCQCAGHASKCTCAPGQCACSSCPRRNQEQTATSGEQDEDEQQNVPMDIAYTPITPSFPPILHHPQPSRACNPQPSSNAGIRIPGLEPFKEYEPPAMLQSTVPNEGCTCQCGRSCQCPAGNCQCDKADDSGFPYNPSQGLVSAPNARDLWSNAATTGTSSPASDPREPEARGSAFPQIARALTASTVFSPCDAPTPAPGFRSPLPSPQRDYASVATESLRPDTPRPVGDSYEHGVRASVEPERMVPARYRESTPAYEDRSLTPSPMSKASPADVEMQDSTPTGPGQRYDREASVLPDAPGEYPNSPPGSPGMNVVPSKALPGARGYRDGTGEAYPFPPPPIPVSPTLRPRKQRAASSSASPAKRNTKSGVQGSKIAKSQPKARSVTRKVTTKIVKGKREVTGPKVRQAVDSIEERARGFNETFVVLQRDGTPPRRSERVLARSPSPCI